MHICAKSLIPIVIVKVAKGDSIVVILVRLKVNSVKLSLTLFVLVRLFSLVLAEGIDFGLDFLAMKVASSFLEFEVSLFAFLVQVLFLDLDFSKEVASFFMT